MPNPFKLEINDLKLYYLVFSVLGFITFAFNNYATKYEIISDNLISPTIYELNIRHGDFNTVHNIDTKHELISLNKFSYTSLSYPVNIDNNNEHLNLTTQIKTDNLDHGNIYWETIRISVYFYDINMQLIKETKHTARYIYGDHDWLFLNKSFLIPPHASYAKASFEFRNSSGKLSVKNTSLKYASEKPNYILTRYTLLFTWIYFISLFIISLIKDITLFQYKFLFLFIIVTIIIAIALPGDIKTIITSHLIQNTELNTRTYDNKGVLNQLKDPMKLGHYTAFLLFSLISLVSLTRKYNHIVIIINLILLSIITEVIQILVAERTPQINDIFIDCYGIITGFIIYTIYFYTIKRINLIENNEKSTSIKK